MSTPAAADLVRFSDVRYFYPDGGRRPLQAYVLLDSHHHVESQGFGVPKGLALEALAELAGQLFLA